MANGLEFTSFATALGWMTLVWKGDKLTEVCLPVASVEEAVSRGVSHGWRECAQPPDWVQKLQLMLSEYLGGSPVDFGWVDVEYSGATEFQRKVYGALRRIPYGSVITYGELASLIGNPGAARAVGRACASNPVPIVVPCHRVVRSGGSIGGFAGGPELKAKLLRIEGVWLS